MKRVFVVGCVLASALLFSGNAAPAVIGDTASTTPRLLDLGVGNGDGAFAGDRELLTTISPNGDGFRDRAVVRFVLTERATVRLEVYRSRSRAKPPELIWQVSAALSKGGNSLVWLPAPETPPRTYLLRLVARDAAGHQSVYGRVNRSTAARSAPGPVVRLQGIDAGLTRRSYRSNAVARLRVATDSKSYTLQLFQAGPETEPWGAGYGRDSFTASPYPKRGRSTGASTEAGKDRPRSARRSGVGALFRPPDRSRRAPRLRAVHCLTRRPDRNRVAVVLATNTWQAYNHQDVDGDGTGDTWYGGRPDPGRGPPTAPREPRGPDHVRQYYLALSAGFTRPESTWISLATMTSSALRAGRRCLRATTWSSSWVTPSTRPPMSTT